MELEATIIELIVHSGEAKSLMLEALASARSGEFNVADEKMAESREAIKKAHCIQTDLIGQDECEGKVPVTLLMVHAQDHLMNTMFGQDLAEEMIHLYRKQFAR
ncbi:PTS lactose/cellobiose transporter subunit IIA [Endozoicomonas gorgoniicola]|uniref:PTS lactose/cellobiose transporter subunit IIA n=1 Tax=Endozoicomonas gorgoniicola TaxID=1234144 RepID=A0ABT3MYL8_9GAMM|nr:PTS lactose/cellobiose transporter subunit IIA [Endozoicomonas gorgoniicola]MCW7554471.1 PTS lactose/cellobiose transporter subunit IIA [Endozoicomonas gorgoniicola]